MSYTKGPWEANGKRVYFGENPIELRSKEDALLCASAPDLLEACKRAFTQIGEDLIDDVFPDLDYEKDYKRLHYMLGQAIAKAEGREGK